VNRGQGSTLNFRARHHSGWLRPSRPKEQRPEQRPHLWCPPPQWLVEPKPTNRTEARVATSLVVDATTVSGWAHADQANRGQSSDLTCSACHHSGWLSPCRPSQQRPEQSPHLSCLPPQWLAVPTPTKGTEARAATSPVVPATTVAGRAYIARNRGQINAFSCRARHHIGWLSPRCRCEKKPEQRPHISCPPPQWLIEPKPTERHRPDQRPLL
jgi:hypothetical protein